MENLKLDENSLILAALEIAREYIPELDPAKPGASVVPTPIQKYAMDTVVGVDQVVNCVNQLRISANMLSGYRTNQSGIAINRHDYVKYMLENFFLRFTSAYDRCLVLANIVFDIGLRDQESNQRTILKNSKVKGTNVVRSFNKLEKQTKKYREVRNRIAHASAIHDDDLRKFEAYYLMVSIDAELKEFENIYKVKMNKFVSERKTELMSDVESLETVLLELFDSLFSEFTIRSHAHA